MTQFKHNTRMSTSSWMQTKPHSPDSLIVVMYMFGKRKRYRNVWREFPTHVFQHRSYTLASGETIEREPVPLSGVHYHSTLYYLPMQTFWCPTSARFGYLRHQFCVEDQNATWERKVNKSVCLIRNREYTQVAVS